MERTVDDLKDPHGDLLPVALFVGDLRRLLPKTIVCQLALGPMSALGQKQTLALRKVMSALPPKADMCSATRRVRLVHAALEDGGLTGLRIMRQALALARHCGRWRELELHNLLQR